MIIINNIFPDSGYIKDANLGHEFINLYQADDGKYYVWLNADGVFTRKLPSDLDILFVTKVSKNIGLYKIVAKAHVNRLIQGAEISGNGTDKKQERYKQQKDLEISYGSKRLTEILSENIDPKTGVPEQDTMITFEVGEIVLSNSKKPCFISFTGSKGIPAGLIDHFTVPKEKFSENLRIYLEGNDETNIKTNLLGKSDYWDTAAEKINKKSLLKEVSAYRDNLFVWAGIAKNENAISNLICRFISEFGLLNDFFDKFLGIQGVKAIDIARERFKEDISIACTDGGKLTHSIIIENKIDADLTDDKGTAISKLVDAIDSAAIRTVAKKAPKDQLVKYILRELNRLIEMSEKKLDDQQKIKCLDRIHCFLLIPDYHKVLFSQIRKNHSWNLLPKYVVKCYSELHEWFESERKKLKLSPSQEESWNYFLGLLKLHTSDSDNIVKNRQDAILLSRM